jgi:hypothetical protein
MMDTQGAWDSRMTKEQSATIFGLTAIFSSKLIYNLQSRIQEDHIDNLDYFTTFATTVLQSMQGHEEDTMIFQQLKKNQIWMSKNVKIASATKFAPKLQMFCGNQVGILDPRLGALRRRNGFYAVCRPSRTSLERLKKIIFCSN